VIKDRSNLKVFFTASRSLAPEVLRVFDNAAVIALKGLSYREFEQLLRHTLLKGHVLPRSLIEQFYATSQGNPRMLAAALGGIRARELHFPDLAKHTGLQQYWRGDQRQDTDDLHDQERYCDSPPFGALQRFHRGIDVPLHLLFLAKRLSSATAFLSIVLARAYVPQA
jgi:hypothetical protein